MMFGSSQSISIALTTKLSPPRRMSTWPASHQVRPVPYSVVLVIDFHAQLVPPSVERARLLPEPAGGKRVPTRTRLPRLARVVHQRPENWAADCCVQVPPLAVTT